MAGVGAVTNIGTDLDIRDDEIAQLRNSANTITGADLLNFLPNDEGNAQRLIAASGPHIRFCHDFRKWLVWDRRRWAIDTTEQVKRLTKLAMLEFLQQAVNAKDKATEKFAKGCLDDRRINAAMAMARPELPIKASELDQHPYLLNFLNGTVDLRTGELAAHSPDHYITKLIHYEYHPGKSTEVFLPFLKQIMGAGATDESKFRAARLIDFLQKAFGYSLTGVTSEKAVFVLWGGGDNGKTTLLELFRSLLHEYAVLLQIDTLMVRSQESNNTQSDLADLRGARFVMTSETEEGQRLAEGKLKRITQGMGKIKAVRKYENPIEFQETHKLWMDANHRPAVRGSDNAIWNRLHLIPFTVTIPKERQDRGLHEKLKSEAEAIMAWTVYGARRWFAEGLGKPLEITQAVSGWRDESDPLRDFIADRCVLDASTSCPVKEIRAAYHKWCEDNADKPIDGKKFNQQLEARGCKQDRVRIQGKQARIWNGIAVEGCDV
jgi:putative DNA primase/helicase